MIYNNSAALEAYFQTKIYHFHPEVFENLNVGEKNSTYQFYSGIFLQNQSFRAQFYSSYSGKMPVSFNRSCGTESNDVPIYVLCAIYSLFWCKNIIRSHRYSGLGEGEVSSKNSLKSHILNQTLSEQTAFLYLKLLKSSRVIKNYIYQYIARTNHFSYESASMNVILQICTNLYLEPRHTML